VEHVSFVIGGRQRRREKGEESNALPPTTPPTLAPTLVELLLLGGGGSLVITEPGPTTVLTWEDLSVGGCSNIRSVIRKMLYQSGD
jgi:hypothetical protein